MTDQPVLLKLPQELYERVHQLAEASDRPVENVLVESLALFFGTSGNDKALIPELLESLTDHELWALVRRPFAIDQDFRLRELTAKGKAQGLSPEDEAETDQLIDAYDRWVLLRSQALLLLKNRGQDIESYLNMAV